MTAELALATVGRMDNQVALVAPSKVSAFAASMQQLYRADPQSEQARVEERRTSLLAAYGYGAQSGADKPFAFAAGFAFIPIHGSLINRFGQSWGYVTGYNFIRSQMNAALADDDVKGIVFDVNSFGGEAAGCFELAAEIAAARELKPSLAVVDSAAYSAGYALASAAGKVALTPSGGVGSVGVIAMHVSMQKLLDSWGIDVTLIYAGEHKADGNPFEKLPEGVRKDIQTSVDRRYTEFTALVSDNTGLDVQKVIDTQAQTYDAEDALALGLIDVVATPAKAVAAFFNELSGSTTHQENSMSASANQVAESATKQNTDAQASADARKAERERISGITSCEEAKGKSALANHLALNTELSVDEAKAILKAASPEAKAEAPKGDAKTEEPNHFAAAMNSSNNPNVGADTTGPGKTELSAGERLLRDCGLAKAAA